MLDRGLLDAPPAGKLVGFFGVSMETQQKVGTFILWWGMFEASCEPAVWALRDEKPTGVKASTESKQISDVLKMLREAGKQRGGLVDQFIELVYAAGSDLLVYRNAIIHGRLSAGPGEIPHIVSNVAWGEEIKKRPQARAELDAMSLDAASEIAETLFCITLDLKMNGINLDGAAPSAISRARAALTRACEKAKALREIADQGAR